MHVVARRNRTAQFITLRCFDLPEAHRPVHHQTQSLPSPALYVLLLSQTAQRTVSLSHSSACSSQEHGSAHGPLFRAVMTVSSVSRLAPLHFHSALVLSARHHTTSLLPFTRHPDKDLSSSPHVSIRSSRHTSSMLAEALISLRCT